MSDFLVILICIVIGLLLRQAQPCKKSDSQKNYVKVYLNQEKDKQEETLTVRGENKPKTDEGSSQNLAIYKEEQVLRMTEEYKIPDGSGQIYSFTPANRDNLVTRIGCPKYLPIVLALVR